MVLFTSYLSLVQAQDKVFAVALPRGSLMMDRFENNMILYRPVGLQELELIYDRGMKAFPPTRCASGTIVTASASTTDLLSSPSA